MDRWMDTGWQRGAVHAKEGWECTVLSLRMGTEPVKYLKERSEGRTT